MPIGSNSSVSEGVNHQQSPTRVNYLQDEVNHAFSFSVLKKVVSVQASVLLILTSQP